MSGQIFSTYPIIGALQKAEQFMQQIAQEESDVDLDGQLNWVPISTNSMQKNLVRSELWEPVYKAVQTLPTEEFDSIADWRANVINEFLRSKKFKIQLNPWPEDMKTFGMAAVIDILRHWPVVGEYGYSMQAPSYKKAFRMAGEGIDFFEADYPIIALQTNSAEKVFITKATKEMSDFKLLEYCMNAQARMRQATFTGAILPYWSFKTKIPVDQLVGLSTEDWAENPWTLTQAVMEGDCALNHEGFSFRAPFAAAVMRSSEMPKKPLPTDHIVNYDIAVWVTRDDLIVPMGVAYLPTSLFSQTVVNLR